MMFSALPSASASPAVAAPSSSRNAATTVPKREHRVHVVGEGESLIGLALRFDVTVAQLREWNSLSFSARIRPGQELTIWMLPSSGNKPARQDQHSTSSSSAPEPWVAIPAATAASSSSSSSSSSLSPSAAASSSVVALSQDEERTGCEIDLQDYIVRHFLLFRQGVLERQWKRQYRPYVYYLVDQYLLEFTAEDSTRLNRAYVIKNASVSRVGSELMISVQHPESREKRGLLILRVGSSGGGSPGSSGEVEAEAAEWEASLAAVAKRTVGTSVSDDVVLTFGKFFASYPLARSESLQTNGFLRVMVDKNDINRIVQFPLYSGWSFAGALAGVDFVVTDALRLSPAASAPLGPGQAPSHEHGASFLSAAAGDRYLDDALDSLLDHYILPQYDVHRVFCKLVSNMTTFNVDDLGCVDGRQQRLNHDWSAKPAWFDEAAGAKALDLLASNTSAVLGALLTDVLPLWLAHPETVLLASCCGTKVDYLNSIVFRKGSVSVDTLASGNSDAQSSIESLIWGTIEAFASILSTRGSGIEVFRPLQPLWLRLSYLRTAVGVIRRRTSSLLSAAHRWPMEHFGMPCNQAYCTFLVSTLASAMLKLFETADATSHSNILLLCRYMAYFLGFEVSRVDSLWSSASAMQALARSLSVLPLTDASALGSELGVQGVEVLLRVLSKDAKLAAIGWHVSALDENLVHKIIAYKLGLDFIQYRPSSALRGSRFILYFILFFWALLLKLLSRYKPVPLRTAVTGGDVASAVLKDAEDLLPCKLELAAAASSEAWPVLSIDAAPTVQLRRQSPDGAGGPREGGSSARRLNTADSNYVHYAATK